MSYIPPRLVNLGGLIRPPWFVDLHPPPSLFCALCEEYGTLGNKWVHIKKKCWREGSSTHIFTPTWLTLSPTNIWCTNEHDSSLQLRRYALFLQSIHNKQHNCFSIRHIDLRLIDTLRTYFFKNNSGVYIVHFYYSRAWGRAKRTFLKFVT